MWMALSEGFQFANDGSGPVGPVVGTIAVVIIAIGIVIYWIRRAGSKK